MIQQFYLFYDLAFTIIIKLPFIQHTFNAPCILLVMPLAFKEKVLRSEAFVKSGLKCLVNI